jgi:hypothetical protein
MYLPCSRRATPTSGWGCGTLTSHPAYPAYETEGGAFPILGAGPGGGQAEPAQVFPWAGRGLDNMPGGEDCQGSLDSRFVAAR